MRKVTDWLLFFFMAVSLPAFSDDNVIDEVVWIIGDEAIYKSEVEEQYRSGRRKKWKNILKSR